MIKKNIILRFKIVFLSFFAFFIFANCGKWPDIVNSKKDVESLSAEATSIRARGLPDSDILSLIRLNNLRAIYFDDGYAVEEAKITDYGLKCLASIKLPNLKRLMLGYCYNITNDGLQYLAKLKTITSLSLMACTGIDDEGLQYLVGMPSLEWLDLRGCPKITDQGIIVLAKMKNLKELLLGGCKNVTPGGFQRLQALMPNCKVEKDEHEWSGHQPAKET